MATSNIGISLSLAGASQVQGGLTAVGNTLGQLDSKALKVGDAFKSFGGMLTGALSVGAIGAFLKGAIDAADETYNLSQKVGIASKDLAGIQLAFKQAGVESGDMQKALVKLSKNVSDGNDSFKAMGVSLKNTDGSLKGSKQVLGEVADVFQKMPDGVDKTALATELFGKAGADLIPMLNGGSAGLEEMAAMAERLGLVIDDQTAASADQFNDTVELLGMSLQGVGRKVAAEMLPTLTRLAGSLLDSATQGDTLKRVAAVLSTALRGLFSVAVLIVEAFNTVGKAIGGTIGAVMAALQGDFAGARQILAESAVDIKAGWTSAGASIASAWDESSDSSVAAAAKIVGAGQRSLKSAKELAAEQEKAAKAAAAYAAEGQKLADSLVAQDNGLSGDFFDKWGKLKAALAAGKIGSDQFQLAQARLLEQQPYMKAALKEQEAATKALEESKKSYLQAFDMVREVELAEVADLQALVARQREHNAAIGLSKDQLADLEQARLRDALATAEQNLQMKIGQGLSGAELEAYTLKVEALRELIKLRDEGAAKEAVLDEAKAARDAWAETMKSIQDGLTDSLFRAFESGKGFFKTFWDGIRNTFKTTVLKMLIQPLIGSAAGGFAGVAQAGGVAGTASQLGTLASIANGIKTGFQILTQGLQGSLAGVTSTLGGFVSQAGSFFGSASLSQFGSGMQGAYLAPGLAGPTTAGAGGAMGAGAQVAGAMQTLGNAAAGYAINRLISGGYSINKTVDVIGQIASLFGPLYGAIGGLANRLFGRKLKEAGIQGTLTAEGFSGQQYEFYKGGFLRSNKTKTSPLDAAVDKLFDDTIRAVVGQTKEYAGALGLPVDAINQATLAIKVNLKGKSQAQIDAAFKKIFEDFSNQLAESVSGAQLKDLALKDETFAQTLERVAVQLTSVNALFDQLGQPLLAASVAGAEAAQNLLELAGGLDALGSRLGSYYNNFYSDAERTAILTDQLAEQFKALGIDALPQTRDEFRRLVESQDLMSESGRSTYVALLKLSDAFASITDAIQETTEAQQKFLAAQLDTAALYATSTDDYLARSAYVQSGGALAVPNGLASGIAAGYLATPTQSGNDAVAETRALREDVRSSQAQVAALLLRVNKVFARWDVDGLPATRTV